MQARIGNHGLHARRSRTHLFPKGDTSSRCLAGGATFGSADPTRVQRVCRDYIRLLCGKVPAAQKSSINIDSKTFNGAVEVCWNWVRHAFAKRAHLDGIIGGFTNPNNFVVLGNVSRRDDVLRGINDVEPDERIVANAAVAPVPLVEAFDKRCSAPVL